MVLVLIFRLKIILLKANVNIIAQNGLNLLYLLWHRINGSHYKYFIVTVTSANLHTSIYAH